MATIGNPIKYSNFAPELFSGNGATTSFTLANEVPSSASVDIYVSGVKQSYTTYQATNKSLIFSEAPPEGTNNIEVIYKGLKAAAGAVADGSVTTAKIADNNITTAKILDANVTTAKIADGNITFAKLDPVAQRFIAQGDSNVGVSDTGANGAVTIAIDGVSAFSRNATGAYSYVRNTSGGNYDTLYQEFQCRAWVNFNGSGTIAIRGSGNVSSITDNGVGDFVLNFATAMPDVNYTFTAMVASDASTAAYAYIAGTHATAVLTTSVRVNTVTNGAAAVDRSHVSCTIHR